MQHAIRSTIHQGPSMELRCYADQHLPQTMRNAIALYRYQVFVEQMGWELACVAGHEQDEFDTAGATHVVAFDTDGRIVGYGRLLPTTQRYLLATHFAGLVHGAPPPRTPAMWELSRYTASDPHGTGAQDAQVGKRVLLAAMRFVAARGGESLICCTTVAIERLSNRWGVKMGRLGPPQRMGDFLLVAGQIQISAEACAALAPSERLAVVQPLPTPEAPLTHALASAGRSECVSA
jgi:acyl homoserine lactone synthase